MTTARAEHQATLLQNGKVLISAGINDSARIELVPAYAYLSSTEVYDPVSRSFAPGSEMSRAWQGYTVTGRSNGKLLFAGGVGPDMLTLSSAELYDAATGKFSATGNMTVDRHGHVATALPDGKVLIVGGFNVAESLPSAELYY
jgi:hypothetical protein